MQMLVRSRRLRSVEFKHVVGRDVPMQPWPQVFYISALLIDRDAYEVRPLTLTGLVKGVGRNLVTMTYWRFMVTLRILGLLSTPESERLSWSHLTWRFWWYWMPSRLRVVRLSLRLWRAVAS